MSSFKDLFSGHSQAYSTFRPGYPAGLFSKLASLCPEHHLAWDCATGSGQAAIGLAEFFDEVIATDASANQIASATPAQGVSYSVAPAEQSGLKDSSANLITVAQALHWFDLDAFTKEANRVLKPEGILAVWTYGLFSINPGLDASIKKLYGDIVGKYWAFERTMVEGGYADVEMPFDAIEIKPMEMNQQWQLADVMGYLNTWSAVREYEKATAGNPLELVYEDMLQSWGEPDTVRVVSWPLIVRAWQKKAGQ